MVGWEINVPFRHKNRPYEGHGLGWRFSSTKVLNSNGAENAQCTVSSIIALTFQRVIIRQLILSLVPLQTLMLFDSAARTSGL